MKTTLRELNTEEHQLIQNDQDLKHILSFVPKKELKKCLLFTGDTITGAVVVEGDGEYLEIWLTTDSAYYDLSASYTKVDF